MVAARSQVERQQVDLEVSQGPGTKVHYIYFFWKFLLSVGSDGMCCFGYIVLCILLQSIRNDLSNRKASERLNSEHVDTYS